MPRTIPMTLFGPEGWDEIPTLVGGFEGHVSAGMNILMVGAAIDAADRLVAEIERKFPAPESRRLGVDEVTEELLRDPNTLVIAEDHKVPEDLEHYNQVLYFAANHPISFNTDVFRLRQAQFEPAAGKKLPDTIKFLIGSSYTLVLERGSPIKILAL